MEWGWKVSKSPWPFCARASHVQVAPHSPGSMDEVVLDAYGSECEIVEAAAVPRRKRCRTAKLTVDMVDKVHKPWLIAVFSSEEPCL